MSWRTMLLVAAGLTVVTTAIASTEASARTLIQVTRYSRLVDPYRGLAPSDFCGGRLPAFGSDACGYREVSYGPNSCWLRLPYRPYSPQPRRVWVCG
jgi:hypothetical protein